MRGIPQTRSAVLGSMALVASAAGQAPPQQWILQFGTDQPDEATALAVDGTGGAFVAGITYGGLVGPVGGLRDAFLARYNNTGGRLWLCQFGTGVVDDARALAPDGAGGAYVAGQTDGDVLLARYNASGAQSWAIHLGSAETDFAWASAPDGAGGVFIAGYTFGSLGGPSAGERDAFIARFDGAGNLVWSPRQFGTPALDSARALTPDGAGGVYVAGETDGDAFLARYDAAGTQLWVERFGTPEGDSASALAADGAGGVFISGLTTGALGLANAGLWDAFLARYDAAGSRLWLTQFGTPGGDRADSLAPDGAGGVFVGVRTAGSLGGPHAGDADAAIFRYDASGAPGWGLQIGTTAWDSPNALAPDDDGGVYVAGDTFGNLGGTNAGIRDAWLARYADACYPDCNTDGQLTVADFGCFQTRFVLADPYADCNADGQHTVADFGCFQTQFVVACP